MPKIGKAEPMAEPVQHLRRVGGTLTLCGAVGSFDILVHFNGAFTTAEIDRTDVCEACILRLVRDALTSMPGDD